MSMDKKVAIIGSGLIGRSWTIIFSSFGYRVQLYDTNPECLARARDIIRTELAELCDKQIARGKLTLDQRMDLISVTDSLAECVKDSHHIQECVFDDVNLKQGIFKEIDDLLGDNNEVAICSSTSVHLPSNVFAKVERHIDQCLVAHPINPPLFVKLVELVPHPKTRESIKLRVRMFMDEIGQKPVVLEKECSGFALNRLQFAVFEEAFRLIHDGIMTPEDVDTVVSDGLGPRYAFMGPWMTAHLNATGVSEYFEKYSAGVYSVLKDCQPLMPLEGEAAQKIVDAMMYQVPVEKLHEKRAWRDRRLVELAKLKDNLDKESQ